MSEIIVGILEEFLDTPRKHNEDKGQIAFDCPACSADKGMIDGDGKGNLEVNYHKGVFKCWACWQYNDMSGSIYTLIKKYGTSKQLKEYALLKPQKTEIVYKDNPETLKLPKGFKSLVYPKTKGDFEHANAIKYLKSRNIGFDIIARHNLGFVGNVITKEDEENLSGRIVIPSYDNEMELNYYTGRAYKKNVWPNYRNPDLDKSQIIFNEGKVNWDATIYLVEGPFDHIVVPNSIPLLGKYISDKLFMKLMYDAKCDIVIVLDDDAELDINYLHKRLNVANLYGRVKVVYLPEGFDIAKVHQRYGPKGVLKILRRAEKIKESSNYTRVKLKIDK